MLVWIILFTCVSAIILCFQSLEVLKFISIGCGLTFWNIREYFPFKTSEFNDALKFLSFFYFWYSFIVYLIKYIFSF
jgi:hypothetical protein